MRRGDLVTVALQGDEGKPRPAIIVQADGLFGDLRTVVLLPLTSDLADFPLTRVTIEPSAANGLHVVSQIMVSRPRAPAREKIRAVIGHADATVMLEVERKLALLLGLAGE